MMKEFFRNLFYRKPTVTIDTKSHCSCVKQEFVKSDKTPHIYCRKCLKKKGMEKHLKFIIEDGNIVIGRVSFHRDLSNEFNQVKGGGRFVFDYLNKTITFFGRSEDFGEATFGQIRECLITGKVIERHRVWKDYREEYNFLYDTGSEILKFE